MQYNASNFTYCTKMEDSAQLFIVLMEQEGKKLTFNYVSPKLYIYSSDTAPLNSSLKRVLCALKEIIL
jgi:hypothetical protein